MSKWELYRENMYLDNLKEELRKVAQDLTNASSDINLVHVELEKNYKINDDRTVSVQRTKKLEDNVNNEADYIINTVIPEVENTIRRNEEEIRRIEEEERQAREAAMAARRSVSYIRFDSGGYR